MLIPLFTSQFWNLRFIICLYPKDYLTLPNISPTLWFVFILSKSYNKYMSGDRMYVQSK